MESTKFYDLWPPGSSSVRPGSPFRSAPWSSSVSPWSPSLKPWVLLRQRQVDSFLTLRQRLAPPQPPGSSPPWSSSVRPLGLPPSAPWSPPSAPSVNAMVLLRQPLVLPQRLVLPAGWSSPSGALGFPRSALSSSLFDPGSSVSPGPPRQLTWSSSVAPGSPPDQPPGPPPETEPGPPPVSPWSSSYITLTSFSHACAMIRHVANCVHIRNLPLTFHPRPSHPPNATFHTHSSRPHTTEDCLIDAPLLVRSELDPTPPAPPAPASHAMIVASILYRLLPLHAPNFLPASLSTAS
ncbi:proline-rich protein 36-like [Penaeus chinensis]|uniref:proline-rich protein 36-like n=1 Tax=Penaeus chinensis TaxID=139456 RepID=UPI001FB7261A|nr:proline-rich protein 36-like [Penaeus chinensis]